MNPRCDIYFSQNQNRTSLRVVFTGGTFFFFFSSQFLFSLLLLSERRNDSVTRSLQCASGARRQLRDCSRQAILHAVAAMEGGGGRGEEQEEGGGRRRKVGESSTRTVGVCCCCRARKVRNPRRVRVRAATPGGCYHTTHRSRCGPRHQLKL